MSGEGDADSTPPPAGRVRGTRGGVASRMTGSQKRAVKAARERLLLAGTLDGDDGDVDGGRGGGGGGSGSSSGYAEQEARLSERLHGIGL